MRKGTKDGPEPQSGLRVGPRPDRQLLLPELTKQKAGGSGGGIVSRSAFLLVAVSFLQTKLKYLAQRKKWRSNLHL